MQKVTLSLSLLLFLIRVFISFIAGLGDFAARRARGRSADGESPSRRLQWPGFSFSARGMSPSSALGEGRGARAGQVIVRMTETFGES